MLEEGLLQEVPFTSRQLVELRQKRKIPFIRVSHRVILYDVEKVKQALAKLEIKEVS